MLLSDLGNLFSTALISGKWKGHSDELWNLSNCDSLNSRNQIPNGVLLPAPLFTTQDLWGEGVTRQD